MYKKLVKWSGVEEGITVGKEYEHTTAFDFLDDDGFERPIEVGEWEKIETCHTIADKIVAKADKQADAVSHPPHYTAHKSGVECIQITEHMGFNLGCALKYIWRCDLKLDAIEDLEKAKWYINREIEKRAK